MLITFGNVAPLVDSTAYVHSSAVVVGDVHVGPLSSIWFHAVVRGDVHHIRIGARSNIQDNATLHVTRERHATILGDDVTVGHNAVLHGCSVGHRCLIAIGAIVLDGCVIGDDCLVGAGAVVTPGTTIAPGHLVLGSPARPVRPLTEAERLELRQAAARYLDTAARYRAQGIA